MKVEIVRGEVKTERIDRSTETPEKEQFEKYIQLYRNVLVNVSVSIKTIEELTDRKREKELNLFFEYCPAFINAVFNNFWAQSVIGLHEFFRGRDYGIEKFIDYAKSNWKKIFTGKWKRTTTWSDGKIEEEIISHKYSEIEERLNRVEQILETNKEVIEKIKTFRDKVFAHIDKDSPADVLRVEELRQMFSVAEEIFNVIASMYNNAYTGLEPVNSNDIGNLVSIVGIYDKYQQQILEIEHRKTEEEVEEYFQRISKNEKQRN